MADGKVKWFSETKGIGLIRLKGASRDVFVHMSVLKRAGLSGLARGQNVTFEVRSGRHGRKTAINIALVGGTHGTGGGPND